MTISSQMEPMLPSGRGELEELALEVYKASAKLSGQVHPVTAKSLVLLLRNVNSYYSNLIEGVRTSLQDIENSLLELSDNDRTRKLQLLHKQNIIAQTTIENECSNSALSITSMDFIRRLHGLLFGDVPEEFLIQYDKTRQRRVRMQPGRLREENVRIGRHIPPNGSELPQLLQRFDEAYALKNFKGVSRVIAGAASHHRLLWIHPFLEGNGRVARLFTDSYLSCSGLEGYGLWTLSRGLAKKETEYKERLSGADSRRRGDYDGRGALSERGLRQFCLFILETALDQALFMNELLSLDAAVKNIELYCRLRTEGHMAGKPPFSKYAAQLLTHVFIHGQLSKSGVGRLIGVSDRKARDVVNQLAKEGFLRSKNQKAPLTMRFPAEAVEFIFPGLCDQGAF